jgi:hypothetical protein
MNETPVVAWCCSVFDSRTKQLPLGRKWRILDWSRVPAEKAASLRAAIETSQGPGSRVKLEGYEEVVETFTLDVSQKLNVSEYREYFDDVSEESLGAQIQSRGGEAGFSSMPFDPDYVEDETGAQTTHIRIIECVHGVKDPVIVGDYKNVICRKLRPAANLDTWSVEKANICSQFLEVVEQIAKSEWLRTPPSVSYVGSKSGTAELVELKIPNVEKTMSILAFVRQMFSAHKQDGLFVEACKIFTEHCGDGGKVWWMNERVSAFARTLDSPSFFVKLGEWKCSEILNMFLYGAGLMHAKPHTTYREDTRLTEAITEHGRERVVVAFHFALHSVMQVPLSVYPVVRQELKYWTDSCQMTLPSRVRLTDLFHVV